MWAWFLRRVSEPSTWAGIAAVVSGAGVLGKVNEAPAIADAIGQAGPALASGDYLGGGMIIAGALAMLLKDKGGK